MKVIELVDVYKIYRTAYYEVHALDGVSMEVEAGEFVAIMGPSGSGKSTLLNMIGCLDKPTKGEVIINGVKTSGLSDRELTKLRRDSIGFIFQQYNLIPTLTALENVELPMIFRGVARAERERRAKELLKVVGIEELADRRPREMSGGQQQRVAIARALANNPKILLCDEPTGNLDTKSGRQVMGILKNLNEENGVTVVLVTHDPSLSEYADRVIRIRDGKVVEDVY
ncbi:MULTISPECIES: ABC transporter ATP-binding protein [Archaeoglobus]|jgi:putative ABC transport system ATP-binding protein|uniref:ABC transporter, ATP-binding protein n=3 Tax=Archaeoglobus fulgidus TaxID=2234 RepID=O28803_ARCFU|nr:MULTISPECIES: ABC transporter ATP-binding protein [Archaeoglobus]AAB89781.1 ABC transporter, ATP-binding protein [Archaeoglobus fulgidus DSM 4304]AIG98480.1 ABC-type antimicrobial peptide transport system, ATPase component [Archaeoglobus fulgidus DSM 8774]KUJ94413.1 MAG: ABC transporter, ATP-binding protein [Archaeoglobus fulgidus]KUK07393.1 MAG: ABC transporter, ATP-binding protein [Archaeoglobus fulgidus]MDI3496680.1 putative transport system ATP-binding protein [Archaeoglobus sp.]